MAGEALLVTQFLAAGLMLLLAGWLLYLNFHSRVVRAFSLFLLMRALQILCNQFSRILGAPFDAEFWIGVRGYVDLAVLPVLGYFLLVYTRQKGEPFARKVGWALIGVLFAVELAYAVDHCFAQCMDGGLLRVGPLGVLVFGAIAGYATLGLVLAKQAASADSNSSRSASFLVASAFFLLAVFDATLYWASNLEGGLQASLDAVFVANAWQWIPPALIFVALVPIAWTVFVFLGRQVSVHRRHAWWVLALAAAEAVVAIWIAAADPQPGSSAAEVMQLAIGAWRTVFPVLVVVAILRHRLFGLDLRIRTGIRRGTAASIIIATFFAVSKIVENIVAAQPWATGQTGIYVGGIVAGLLLFALSPLQRIGERVAQAAVPMGASKEKAECLRFYRDQAEIAWSDGVMGRRERLLLDQLRDRLGIRPDEASRIEHDLLASSRPAPKHKADASVRG